ncbi:AAA family ATPase [Altererythrobacter salegens]|uniref:AAA family ATPase n=1 Tax=Croceibacterium salegens TaxID=1737568 RepID=A0A6I4SSU8_9SPHN|nr:ParA family protein [Croceibacterium salegens]MXO59024.1 AAA family ATPase [Croceibacterium salegens]
MTVIAVYSVKGGVGKTTLAVDFAWRCASVSGHRTQIWDLDPQGGSGYLLDKEPPSRARAISVFGNDGKPRKLITASRYPNLDMLPGDISLCEMPVQLVRIVARKRISKICRSLSSDYDRIIRDCPPMMNEVSNQIIRAADVIVLPLPPSPLSARAMAQVRAELARHDRHPPVLPVLSMYDTRRRLHREAREGFAQGWPVIPASTWGEQAAARRAPVPTFANWSDTSKGMERLWTAVERKLEEMGQS